ncbi:MAG: outer membrane protein assembly factor BamD [Formosimonas sp.]|jgi:outer membrane protein assembly factor BamD
MTVSILKKAVRISAIAIVSVSLLAGCSIFGNKKDKNEFAGWSVERMYTEARDNLNSKDYTRAAELLEATTTQYPFSAQAVQAQLELPYAYWKDEERGKAVAAADRFIALNGSHPKVDYVYYIKGMINYNQNVSYLATLTGQGLSDRDPKAAVESFNAFKTLTEKYPNSRYAKDARLRMVSLVNNMSAHEAGVAVYYYERGAYLAAINRSQDLLKTYDGTPATEDALITMYHSYEQLGMTEQANDALTVLKKNYPDSTLEMKKTNRSLFSRSTKRDRKKAEIEIPAPE